MTRELRRELATVAKSVYWSEAEGRIAVAAWRASGESATQFGDKHGLTRGFLERWRKLLNWSRLTSLIAFYDMLMRHIDGVVAWARYRLTNAALEGNNARVRAISQRAHGYRNPNNLMLVLYHASWR